MNYITKKLTSVRNRIEDQNNWCKGSYAKDEDGISVNAYSELACRWCLEGALLLEGIFVEAESLRKELNIKALSLINDNDGHFAALEALDKLILLSTKKYK